MTIYSNVPAHVKLQVENGIDAIITDELERTLVDRVALLRSAVIRAEFRGKDSSPKIATLAPVTPSFLTAKATT